MKKYLVYLVFIVYCLNALGNEFVECNFFKLHPLLSGDVTISQSTKTKGEIKFIVEAPESGFYFFNAWMMPSIQKDGAISKYSLIVNGKLEDMIVPKYPRWSVVSCLNKKINLIHGDNEIVIKSGDTEIPEVEFIKLSKSFIKAEIDTKNYDNNYNRILTSLNYYIPKENIDTLNNLSNSQLESKSYRISNSYNNPLGNYDYYIGMPIRYTFYKYVYFDANESSAISVTTNNNFNFAIELFSYTNPETYSWSAASINGVANLNQTIPVSGYYYVRVRSLQNATTGLGNVTIKNNTYQGVQIWGAAKAVIQPAGTIYNSFTCHDNIDNDPIMWIEEGTGHPGIISDFNNDNQFSSDYQWNNNPRIKVQFPRQMCAVHVTSARSYLPDSYCHLYARCQNSTIDSYFENLNSNDAIQSAPSSSVYNCISWSVGITDSWSWPPDDFASVSSDPLTCFDYFYNQNYGNYRYTRQNVNPDSCQVDLWALLDQSGDISNYTHASVGFDGVNVHGYDWESKPGSLMRTFHPRNSLRGNEYGSIVYHYRRYSPTLDFTESSSLLESIAEGTASIETVEYNNNELNYINWNISSIPQSVIDKFQSYYQKWQKESLQSPHSDYESYTHLPYYSDLINLYLENPKIKYLIFHELSNNFPQIVNLVHEILLKNNDTNMSILKNIVLASINNNKKNNVICSYQTNLMKLVKIILGNEISLRSNYYPTTINDVFYSNSSDVKYSVSGKNVFININLINNKQITIGIYSLDGRLISTVLPTKIETKGLHTYDIQLPKGISLIKVQLGKILNVKKISID